MKRLILTVVVLLIISSSVFPAQWIAWFDNPEGSLWYYDNETVSTGRHTIQVSAKKVLSDQEKAGYKKKYRGQKGIEKITYVLCRFEINCSSHAVRTLSQDWCASDGTVIVSCSDSHNPQLKEIVPDNLLEPFAILTCENIKGGK